jgi:hypothetical protein
VPNNRFRFPHLRLCQVVNFRISKPPVLDSSAGGENRDMPDIELREMMVCRLLHDHYSAAAGTGSRKP